MSAVNRNQRGSTLIWFSPLAPPYRRTKWYLPVYIDTETCLVSDAFNRNRADEGWCGPLWQGGHQRMNR